MANPFEEFIQVELPLRGVLLQDVAQESVIIRRGQGARMLAGVQIEEGQVLGMVGGQLASVPMSSGGGGNADSSAFTQAEPALTWEITHNRNNVNVAVSVYDDENKQVFPDEVTTEANRVVITFMEAMAGRAVLIFVPVVEPEEPE